MQNAAMSRLNRYVCSERGNVSILFSAAMIGVALAAGVAVDYGRRNAWVSRVQTAADSAALAAASLEGTLEERKAAALSFFTLNLGKPDAVTDPDVAVEINGDSVSVRATANLKSSFMGIAGIETMPISATSVASGGDTAIEIALVLDVSGSMRHSLSSATPRIEVLKKAAKSLVNVVSQDGARMKRVKVGVVPFNMNVNIGTANKKYVQGTGSPLFARQAWAGCVMERALPAANTDDYMPNDDARGNWHAYAWPPEPNSNSRSCVNRSDGTNTGYAAVDPPSGFAVLRRGPNYNCVRHPVMPLSNSYKAVIDKIDQLTAEWNMGTIIAPGVAWGLRVLSPGEPFTEGRAYSPRVKKYMIVLTDGELTTEAEYKVQGSCHLSKNTKATYHFDPSSQGLPGRSLSTTGPRDTYSAYGYIRDADPFNSSPASWADVRKDLNKVSLDACNQAKAAGGDNGIEVFTIAVSDAAGKGTAVSDLLQACASQPDNYFIATNDDALMGAFRTIAAKISQIRLTE